MNISFNELRNLKDSLPDGAMGTIATKLGLEEEAVRNYFGGSHFEAGTVADVHYEKGPNGGFVKLEDTAIFDMAKQIVSENSSEEE